MKKLTFVFTCILYIMVLSSCSKDETSIEDKDAIIGTGGEAITVGTGGEDTTKHPEETENDTTFIEPSMFAYVCDGELYLYNDGSTMKITNGMQRTIHSDNNRFVITDNLSKIIYYDFPSVSADYEYSSKLYVKDLTNAKEVCIASGVTDFKVNQAGSLIYYISEGALYVYDLSSNVKICDDVSEFDITNDGKKVIYKTNNNLLYTYSFDGGSQTIANDVLYYKYSSDFNVIAFNSDDVLYYKTGNTSPVEIGGVYSSNFYLTDDNGLYYVGQKKFPLSDFIIDDMEGSTNEYSEQIRTYMSTETFSKCSLCYYENGRNTILSDWMYGLDDITVSLNNNMIVYYDSVLKEYPKIKLSELTTTGLAIIRRKIYNAAREVSYNLNIAAGEKKYLLEEAKLDKYNIVHYVTYSSLDNKLYYFKENYGQAFEICEQSFINNIPGKLRKLYYSNPNGFIIDSGDLICSVNARTEDDILLHDVYINNSQVLSGVFYEASVRADAMPFRNIKRKNDKILFTEIIFESRDSYSGNAKLKYFDGDKTVLISDTVKRYHQSIGYLSTLLPNGDVAYLDNFTGEDTWYCDLKIFDGTSSKVLHENVTQLIEIEVDTSTKMAYALQAGEYMYSDMN